MADGMKARLQRFNLFNNKQEQKDVSQVITAVKFACMLSGQLANINRSGPQLNELAFLLLASLTQLSWGSKSLHSLLGKGYNEVSVTLALWYCLLAQTNFIPQTVEIFYIYLASNLAYRAVYRTEMSLFLSVDDEVGQVTLRHFWVIHFSLVAYCYFLDHWGRNNQEQLWKGHTVNWSASQNFS